LRTAKDSDAMLRLSDGSMVEMRERSGFSTTSTASDLTVHLMRGSIIVQAAKRSRGHLYVATTDCRVAVTGTVFSVSSGVKGSRVSVIQGEVHVTQDNQEKVLHPGGQFVSNANMQPMPVRDDVSWSRNRNKLYEQLEALRVGLQQIHLPAMRYSSRLLGKLPASTVVYGSIPNLAGYLGQAQTVFRQQLSRSPELQAALKDSSSIEPMLEKLRASSEYLGEEVALVAVSIDGRIHGPVLVAETVKPGFPEFLKKQLGAVPVAEQSGIVFFGPERSAVDAVSAQFDKPGASFQGTPFYAAINESFTAGTGMIIAADMSRIGSNPVPGARFFIAEQRDANDHGEVRASLGFDGQRSGIAALLSAPAPMPSLDYVSPDATVVAAFVVSRPQDIVTQLLGVTKGSPAAAEKALSEFRQEAGFDIQKDLAACLGGEFSLSLDGPAFPVPSWKLVAEVYDTPRLQAGLTKLVNAYNQQAAAHGGKPLRTSQEVVDGRTYYMIAAADPNPLTEAHYTFADGYLVAGPTRVVVTHALQVKTAGTSVVKSTQFQALAPKDHYNNFSAVVYQNLGTTLAPLVNLLGAFAQQGGRHEMPAGALQGLGNMKPTLVAAYGEPDRVTVAGSGEIFGSGMSNLITGNLLGTISGHGFPVNRMVGTPQH
jgi:hypothetical protein